MWRINKNIVNQAGFSHLDGKGQENLFIDHPDRFKGYGITKRDILNACLGKALNKSAYFPFNDNGIFSPLAMARLAM